MWEMSFKWGCYFQYRDLEYNAYIFNNVVGYSKLVRG